MKARSIAGIALLAVAGIAVAGIANSQSVPLVQQGRLFDATTDMPVEGALDVTFRIYDGPAAPTPLWEETQNLTFANGYFNAELGVATAIDPTVLNGPTRFLGIAIGGEELTPRSRVGAVPYALDAVGDIHPASVSIQGYGEVIDNTGRWKGLPIVAGDQAGYDIGSCMTLDSETTFVACAPQSGSTANITVEAGDVIAHFVTTSFYRQSGSLNLASIELAPCYRPAGSSSTPVVPGFAGRTNSSVSSNGLSQQGTASSSMVWTAIAPGAYDFLLCAKKSPYTPNADNTSLYGPKITVLKFSN